MKTLNSKKLSPNEMLNVKGGYGRPKCYKDRVDNPTVRVINPKGFYFPAPDYIW